MLSTPVVTALVIGSLVFAIILGNIKKINIGIIALACAWIIGCWLGGNFASAITSLFPIKVVMYLICITFFYGFAISNGTMQKLGDKLMYLFRNHVKLIPFAIPLGAVIVAGCGGGGLMGDIVMVPIAMLLAARIGMSPLLALSGVVVFAPVGGRRSGALAAWHLEARRCRRSRRRTPWRWSKPIRSPTSAWRCLFI